MEVSRNEKVVCIDLVSDEGDDHAQSTTPTATSPPRTRKKRRRPGTAAAAAAAAAEGGDGEPVRKRGTLQSRVDTVLSPVNTLLIYIYICKDR